MDNEQLNLDTPYIDVDDLKGSGANDKFSNTDRLEIQMSQSSFYLDEGTERFDDLSADSNDFEFLFSGLKDNGFIDSEEDPLADSSPMCYEPKESTRIY